MTRAAGDRPAGVPMLARGLFALHSRYGRLPFEQIVTRAEQLARFGTPVSRAFARDLAVVAAPLAADPGTRPFFGATGQPLAEGATLRQPDLAVTLATLRTQGVGDLYQGGLARKIAAASAGLGAGLTADALRAGLPRFVPAVTEAVGRDLLAVPPTDAGVATVGALRVLREDPAAVDAAQGRAAALASGLRAGREGVALLADAGLAPGRLPPLPASAGLLALDRDGRSVACAVSMGNLFGTGRVVPETGILLGASPAAVAPALLARGWCSTRTCTRSGLALWVPGRSRRRWRRRLGCWGRCRTRPTRVGRCPRCRRSRGGRMWWGACGICRGRGGRAGGRPIRVGRGWRSAVTDTTEPSRTPLVFAHWAAVAFEGRV